MFLTSEDKCESFAFSHVPMCNVVITGTNHGFILGMYDNGKHLDFNVGDSGKHDIICHIHMSLWMALLIMKAPD